MGLFKEFIEDLQIAKASGVAKIVASQQTPEERKILIEKDRERIRIIELNKPFELEGSL